MKKLFCFSSPQKVCRSRNSENNQDFPREKRNMLLSVLFRITLCVAMFLDVMRYAFTFCVTLRCIVLFCVTFCYLALCFVAMRYDA